MKKSIIKTTNGKYRITITSSTDDEKAFLEEPLSEIQEKVNQFFDQAVKEELGEDASISLIVDDSGLPYEILAYVTIGEKTSK